MRCSFRGKARSRCSSYEGCLRPARDVSLGLFPGFQPTLLVLSSHIIEMKTRGYVET